VHVPPKAVVCFKVGKTMQNQAQVALPMLLKEVGK
jgi:hypothetical protein